MPITRGLAGDGAGRAKVYRFDPKQPQTTHEMFREKCLGEAIRPLTYPLNLALGTDEVQLQQQKLDHINYRNSARSSARPVPRRSCWSRSSAAWFEEAVLLRASRSGAALRSLLDGLATGRASSRSTR